MQATTTPSLSNFCIMEFLGLMAAIPRCIARPTAVACLRPPTAPSAYQVPIVHNWIYFMFTIVLEPDDAASTIFLQDDSTHITR